MKYCASCGNEMPDPIDEFGDPRAPVCVCCWLNPSSDNETEIVILDLEKAIADTEEEMGDLQGQIDDLEGELLDLRVEKRKLEKQVAELRKNGTTTLQVLKRKLSEWIKGESKHDKTDMKDIFKVNA